MPVGYGFPIHTNFHTRLAFIIMEHKHKFWKEYIETDTVGRKGKLRLLVRNSIIKLALADDGDDDYENKEKVVVEMLEQYFNDLIEVMTNETRLRNDN